jgi:hypothetical protein
VLSPCPVSIGQSATIWIPHAPGYPAKRELSPHQFKISNRLQRCYERTEKVIDAFFDLADTIITVRSLIRYAWTTHRWDTRPHRRP